MPRSGQGNLYLIGYRASGKSTVAPVLANRLSLAFVDTDRLIEAELSGSIATFFANHGEPAFRDIESGLSVMSAKGPIR